MNKVCLKDERKVLIKDSIDIILLSLLIIITTINTCPVRELAAILLITCLIWAMHAATLNAGIWLIND